MKNKRDLFYAKLSTCDKPMRYFQFKIFIQIPLAILSIIGNFCIYNLDASPYAYEATTESTAILLAYTIITVIMLIFMHRELYAFKKRGITIIYIYNSVNTFIRFSLAMLFLGTWASFVSSIPLLCGEFIYFQKRKHLFDNSDNRMQIKNPSLNRIKEENVYYCKHCGSKYSKCDIKCHSCGKRVRLFVFPKKSKLKTAIVIFAITALLGVCVIKSIEVYALEQLMSEYSSRVYNLNKDKAELQEEVYNLKSSNELMRKNNDDLVDRNIALKKENSELKASNNTLKVENSNLQENNNTLTSINKQLSENPNTSSQTQSKSETNTDGESVIGEHYIKIKSASLEKNTIYGGNNIIVICEWTNNSDSDTSYMHEFKDKAYQNGAECDSATPENYNDYYDARRTKIKPGASYEVMLVYRLKNNTDNIEVEIFSSDDYFNDSRKYVTKTFSIK